MSATPDAEAWDQRIDRALVRAPAALQRAVAWLREPARRWMRLGAGALFVLGGVLSILPVFGLWMLPLGLALLAEESAGLKRLLERAARRGEALWARLRRNRRSSP